jgi:hypothetical protein
VDYAVFSSKITKVIREEIPKQVKKLPYIVKNSPFSNPEKN